MSHTMSDARYALRRLRKSPMFTTFAVVTLALGIGATTAVYSMVHAVLSPPAGVANIDRIVNVYTTPRGSIPMIALSWGDYQDLRARQTVFDKVTGWIFDRFALAANGRTETSFGEFVGGDYFDVLGVQMALGRPIHPADDVAGAPPVVVISHRIWQRMFDGAADAIGKSLRLNGRDFQIVGVASAEFSGLFNGGFVTSAAWTPFAAMPYAGSIRQGSMNMLDRRSRWVLVKGRLAEGRTIEQASAEVTSIARQLDVDAPLRPDAGERYVSRLETSRPWQVRRARDIALNEGADFMVRPMATVLMVVVGLVLAVAGTNLANLMLARGTDRRHEITVRRALGATRWRLVREVLIESLSLTAVGGALGLLLAQVLMVVMSQEFGAGNGVSLRVVPRMDAAVLASTLISTLVVLLIAGLVPAWHSTRVELRASLAGGSAHTGVPRWRGRRFLIASQVTVSIVLVAAAALCVSQVRTARMQERGVDLDRVAFAEVDFAGQQYDQDRIRQIGTVALEQLSRQPEIEAASLSSGWPIFLRNPGAAVGAGSRNLAASMIASTKRVFDALGLQLLHGRTFDARDTSSAEAVAILSRNLAERIFDDPRAAIGKRVTFKRNQWVGDPTHPKLEKTVVGVVSDSSGSGSRDGVAVYVPFDQQTEGHLVFSARTTGDPTRAMTTLRQTLAGIDPTLAIAQLSTGPSLVATEMLFFRVTAGLAAMLGAFALVLALAGLYGVLSHVVGRRTREIGVRIALGADRARIVRMVVRDGLHPVASGIVLGLILGAIARMSLSPMFTRLAPAMDPVVLTSVPLAMLAAGALACYLPARRAAKIDPNVALRD